MRRAKRLENLPADCSSVLMRPNEQGWYTSGKVYVNVWNYDAHWGPVYYSDSGKTKVAMSKDKTHDGYANSLLRAVQGSVYGIGIHHDTPYVQYRTVGRCHFGDDRDNRPVRQPLYCQCKLVTPLLRSGPPGILQ